MSNQFVFFSRRMAFGLCIAAALWFALGGGLKVLLAHATGKSIEMVICTGSGLKKIAVPLEASSNADHEKSIKHCGNTPLAIAPSVTHYASYLTYTQPKTLGIIETIESPMKGRDWMRNGHPPPGRAPPAVG